MTVKKSTEQNSSENVQQQSNSLEAENKTLYVENKTLCAENDELKKKNEELLIRIDELEGLSSQSNSSGIIILAGNSGKNEKAVRSGILSLLENSAFHIENVIVIGQPVDGFKNISLEDSFNLVNILKTAMLNDVLTNEFIYLPENVFTISPVILADIQILKKNGQIRENTEIGQTTAALLRKKNLPIVNYSTPMPVCLEKEKIAELFEAFPEIQEQEVDFISPDFVNASP